MGRYVVDIETNRLFDPDIIWCIVCRNADDETDVRTFIEPLKDRDRFIEFSNTVSVWIGHNFIGYDKPNMERLLGITIPIEKVVDTLVVSRLLNYEKVGGHSLEAYGEEFGVPKVLKVDYSCLSDTLVNRCVIDTLINLKVYNRFYNKGYLKGYPLVEPVDDLKDNLEIVTTSATTLSYLGNTRENLKVNPSENLGYNLRDNQVYIHGDHEVPCENTWLGALEAEHKLANICFLLHKNGFFFNLKEAKSLLSSIEEELSGINSSLSEIFKPRAVFVREIHPRRTKYGTLNKSDFRFVKDGDLSDYSGDPFCLIKWVPFNPDSPKQLVRVLNEAGWKPTDKTKGHLELERELNFKRGLDLLGDPRYPKLVEYRKNGFKVNETNLLTLPQDAPEPAKRLTRRILLESRRRTLVEWSGLCNPHTHRIHGHFNHIGSWTHRMSHVDPNTANIPRHDKLYGSEMRAMWGVPQDRLLIGVDAVGIQLRILAHYINDKEFTEAVTSGDIHELNKRSLGPVCKDREVAKTFIYAWLLGAGVSKIAEILSCSTGEAKHALEQFTNAYEGLKRLKEEQIPKDAARGFFQGLDGRYVRIKGTTESERKHLTMSGYLQNGEKCVMAHACVMWNERLANEQVPFWMVDLVHDEFQTETINDFDTAVYIATVQAGSIRKAGEKMNLNCPMDGSFKNKKGEYTIGPNWLVTH